MLYCTKISQNIPQSRLKLLWLNENYINWHFKKTKNTEFNFQLGQNYCILQIILMISEVNFRILLIFIICFPAITLGPSTIRAIIGCITSFTFWWKTITTWTSNFHGYDLKKCFGYIYILELNNLLNFVHNARIWPWNTLHLQ